MVTFFVAGLGLASAWLWRSLMSGVAGAGADGAPLAAPPKSPAKEVPVKLQPTPKPTGALRGDEAFLTLTSNAPAHLYVDGVRQPGRTPFERVAVSAGTHKIVVESVVTGERREFSVPFRSGEARKYDEHFAYPGGAR